MPKTKKENSLIGYDVGQDFLLLIFTDLDGTLLDHETYSFEPALPAIELLKEKRIPLIICTSKTRAEIEEIRSQLQNIHPFISENGGAIFIPKGYFSFSFSFDKEEPDYFIIELGTPYPKLREVLKRMRRLLLTKIKGFGDLSSEEIAHLCGFSVAQAELAKQREYDEPFFLEDETAEDTIYKMAAHSHLQITRGGRFYHLIGNNSKGKAVVLLKDIYKKKSRQLKTIALGDSLNDLPMLKAVDYPVLVQKVDGSYDPQVKLKNLIKASGSGPSGWQEAIYKLVNRLW